MRKLLSALLISCLWIGSAFATTAVMRDTNYTLKDTDTQVITGQPFTAVRTATLPGLGAGGTNNIAIIDAAGAINGSNNLVIAAQSGETVNGASSITIATTGAAITIVRGPSGWFANSAAACATNCSAPANNLNASTAPTVSNDNTQGYSVGSVWQNASTGQYWIARSVSTGAAAWTLLSVSDFSSYVADRWYIPWTPMGRLSGASANPGNGAIKLFPFTVKERFTANALGSRITTLAAAGNCQFAAYANNAATLRPTGTALAATASIATDATGSVNSAISYQFNPGVYWLGTNCDNTTVILSAWDVSAVGLGQVIGSATQVNNLGGSQSQVGLTVTQAFGTWPDLTGATFTDVTTAIVPVVQIKVGSVP